MSSTPCVAKKNLADWQLDGEIVVPAGLDKDHTCQLRCRPLNIAGRFRKVLPQSHHRLSPHQRRILLNNRGAAARRWRNRRRTWSVQVDDDDDDDDDHHDYDDDDYDDCESDDDDDEDDEA